MVTRRARRRSGVSGARLRDGFGWGGRWEMRFWREMVGAELERFRPMPRTEW